MEAKILKMIIQVDRNLVITIVILMEMVVFVTINSKIR